MRGIPTNRYLIFGGIAAAGCALDLATKHWIFQRLGMPSPEHDEWRLLDGVFSLTTSLNEGALFGLGQGQGLVFSLLSVCAAAGIFYWLFIAGAAHDRLLTVSLGLVTGGILGNLYDRLGLPGLVWGAGPLHAQGAPVYAVRDWLHFRIAGLIDWPIFNVADSLLVCGAALLVWHALWTPQPAEGARAVDRAPTHGG